MYHPMMEWAIQARRVAQAHDHDCYCTHCDILYGIAKEAVEAASKENGHA